MTNILEVIKQCFEVVNRSDARTDINSMDFVICLVFSIANDGGKKSIASLRRTFQKVFQKPLSRGGFWERLATRSLTEALTQVLKILGVAGIVLMDSTSLTLPKAAKKRFPGPRSKVSPASAKLHLLFDAVKGVIEWFEVTPAKTHDSRVLPNLSQFAVGTLLIFDLGYWDLNSRGTGIFGAFFYPESRATLELRYWP
jgi:hypothetical protein